MVEGRTQVQEAKDSWQVFYRGEYGITLFVVELYVIPCKVLQHYAHLSSQAPTKPLKTSVTAGPHESSPDPPHSCRPVELRGCLGV